MGTIVDPLLILIYIIALSPFIVIGIYHVFSALATIFRVRLGYIKVFKKLPNDRIISMWKKPKGNTIDMDGVSHAVRLDKDWCYFTASLTPVPTVYYDNNNVQVPIVATRTKVPAEEYEIMYNLAYAAGRASVFKSDKRIMIYMLIAIVGVVVAAGGILYMNMQFDKVATAVENLKTTIENAVIPTLT